MALARMAVFEEQVLDYCLPTCPGAGDDRWMLRIGTIVLGAADVRRAAMFWVQALDYLPRGEVADDWAVLVPADGRPGPGLSLGRSETPVQEYPRVHLDLYAADQAAEVERLVALGAARVDWDRYEEGSDFVVLADTEGNRFCVIDTGGQRQPPQQPLGSVASSP